MMMNKSLKYGLAVALLVAANELEYRYPNGVILKVTSPVVVGTCIPYSLSEQ